MDEGLAQVSQPIILLSRRDLATLMPFGACGATKVPCTP